MDRRRGHRLLPTAVLLALQQKSTSLMLPHQIPALQYSRKWRRIRTAGPLQHGVYPGQDDMLSSAASRTYLVHNQLLKGASGRTHTSLLMAKNSGPTGGFGRNDDRNKKKGNGNSKSGSGRKANSSNRDSFGKQSGGGPKGSASQSSSGKGNRSKDDDNKAKRPKRRNSNKGNGMKMQGNKPKSNGNKGQSKSKAKPNTPATVGANKSSIQTSGANTSLKGFKSESRPGETQTPKEQLPGGGALDDTVVDSDVSGTSDESDEVGLQKRVVQLEMLVSKQVNEIRKLRSEIDELTKSVSVFQNVVDVLREAGLRIDENEEVVVMSEEVEIEDGMDSDDSSPLPMLQQSAFIDDMEIFGIAPKSVTDAADAAGASILSAILAGKQRMLVDVRDAELTRDSKLFVEFIELSILPVAAGLEGLDGDEYRNRVKIVFPTVKELMSYRRSMALAAPEVVSLSTLGFDPVDQERDKLIVVIAPSPDDIAGVHAIERLMARTDRNYVEPDLRITQPVVVLNHHMVPIDMASFGKFTSVYHLRLLSVQYMTGDSMPEYVAKEKMGKVSKDSSGSLKDAPEGGPSADAKTNSTASAEEAALEAAMTHAHEIGVHQGVTRAMVIRAYPKPWHVFVDTSPDTDADFVVAATFDIEPTQEDVNYAIVECLEGSEREDEIVAQQMQAALEAGQLNRVSDMLGIEPTDILAEDTSSSSVKEDKDSDDKPFKEYDGNDWDDLFYDDWLNEDSL
ncbi:hypothetical protein ACHAXT_006139 [Thalassiosira profunda]